MKRSLATLALALLMPTAFATTWNFSYTGLEPTQPDDMFAFTSLSGTFSGSDVNHDGSLTANELTAMSINLNGTWQVVPLLDGDLTHPNSELGRFEFDLGHNLSFDALSTRWHEAIGVNTGVSASYLGGTFSATSNWGDNTRLAIAPVPEPGTVALMAVGVLPLALRARRRRVPAPAK